MADLTNRLEYLTCFASKMERRCGLRSSNPVNRLRKYNCEEWLKSGSSQDPRVTSSQAKRKQMKGSGFIRTIDLETRSIKILIQPNADDYEDASDLADSVAACVNFMIDEECADWYIVERIVNTFKGVVSVEVLSQDGDGIVMEADDE